MSIIYRRQFQRNDAQVVECGRVIGMSGFGVRLRHRAVEAIAAGEGWTSLKTRLRHFSSMRVRHH